LSGSGHNRVLKILHIDPERGWGGGEAQVFGLLRWLAAKGHQNELVADPKGSLFAKCQDLGIRCRPIVIRNDLDLRCVPSLRQVIRSGRFDIVHFHTKRAHNLSPWLPLKRPRAVYLVTRRMDYPERRNWRTHLLYNRQVDGVVAISQAIADLLVEAGVDGSKIRVIPSGIETQRFSIGAGTPRRLEGVTVVGSLGALEERKGHRFLLDAAALLKGRSFKLEYRIAGMGSLRQQLEQQAARLGLANDVRFFNFVKDTAPFLADIDLFVMPSLSEGLGVAALEAMAARKPVIASRVGGLAESVVEGVTGLLVAPGDAVALAQAIEQLVRAPELAASMAAHGRERVERNYTLEQMALRNETYYYELLQNAAQLNSLVP
jgi:glycosyltransferase involved in cell wall biosynthesis